MQVNKDLKFPNHLCQPFLDHLYSGLLFIHRNHSMVRYLRTRENPYSLTSLSEWGESESESHSVMYYSLQPPGLYSPWNSPGQNTGVGSLSLLQEIFPIQWLNPGLPHYRWILNQLSHKGSPRILEWVAYPFSRGSSQPWNWTRVSSIAGGFFTNWATREAL